MVPLLVSKINNFSFENHSIILNEKIKDIRLKNRIGHPEVGSLKGFITSSLNHKGIFIRVYKEFHRKAGYSLSSCSTLCKSKFCR